MPKLEVPGIHSRNFIDDIMDSPNFQDTLKSLSEETGRTLDDVEKEARETLPELAAESNGMAIEAWDKVCRWLGRAYKLDVNHKQIERLRELNKGSTLVFLPNHRSYLDPMILRSALERHGFPPNHTFGGANLSFWPLGPIMRRNGAVFIRREFKGALVYKATLKAYMVWLVKQQQNLEWYIEGGRTRTGKLRPPRMGILSYLVDAFNGMSDDEEKHDVLLIPVYVGYDQQYEVGAISNEEQGGKKDPESVSWLIKLARAQTKRRGTAHLRFGDPVSLRDALAETSEGDARLAVPKIAFEVSHRINKVTPVMPSALITFALLDNNDRAITLREGRQILDPVLRYIRARGLDMSNDINLAEQGGLTDAVNTLVREGVIDYYDGGLEPVFRVNEKRFHEAAFYRNTLIHYFITRAIMEIALVKAVENDHDDPLVATWDEALHIRDILKYEFFFSRKSHFERDLELEANLAYPGWREENFESMDLLQAMHMSNLYLAPRVLAPFLEAYGIFADRLAAHDEILPIDQNALLIECIGVGQQRWLQNDLYSPESISKDLFANAFQLANNRKLIESEPGIKARRQAFADEFHELIRLVDVVREMATEKGEEF